MKILVTGANGFIGRHLCAALKDNAHEVVEIVRNSSEYHQVAVGDIAEFENWEELLQDVDCIIHLAAMVHQMKGNTIDAFEHANVHATEKLLQAAKIADCKHFVFFSTIAVMGYASDVPLPESHIAPYSPYSHSKLQAERLVQDSGLNHSIIRIPLTYGAGVRANFRSLIKAVEKGLPLPFGMVRNQRSLLYVGNLCDAVVRLMELPNKPKMLLLSDAHASSTPELIKEIANVLGVKAHLLPVPTLLLKIGAKLVGKQMMYHQLCGSLVMDSKPTYEALNWLPPYCLNQGLQATIAKN
jgi:nucleoside-diphosphate-sugar epimerase